MVNKAEEKAEVRVTSILTYDKKLVEVLNPYFRQKHGRDILIWDTSKRDDGSYLHADHLDFDFERK
ncbi:hypothetical protein [Leptospira kmetyi]|uniref:hypothetical protein n=1 Tax=Leptospira kmetyi TaxID=408139 RepID=UPI003EBE412F